MSIRGEEWKKFSEKVLNHIETYTVPQYGDKGEDLATDYSVEDLLKQANKYLARYGKNQRQGQEMLDFMKTAHYIQMAATTFEAKENML